MSVAMRRLAQGHRHAFDEVFQLSWPKLRDFCIRTLGGVADGEDAAQLALEKVFAEAPDYDVTRPALPWALTLASWECMTLRQAALRRAARSTPLDSVSEAALGSSNPEEVLGRERLLGALDATLAALAPADRQALSGQGILSELPRSPAERKRKQRALERLRRLWRSLDDD